MDPFRANKTINVTHVEEIAPKSEITSVKEPHIFVFTVTAHMHSPVLHVYAHLTFGCCLTLPVASVTDEEAEKHKTSSTTSTSSKDSFPFSGFMPVTRPASNRTFASWQYCYSCLATTI